MSQRSLCPCCAAMFHTGVAGALRATQTARSSPLSFLSMPATWLVTSFVSSTTMWVLARVTGWNSFQVNWCHTMPVPKSLIPAVDSGLPLSSFFSADHMQSRHRVAEKSLSPPDGEAEETDRVCPVRRGTDESRGLLYFWSRAADTGEVQSSDPGSLCLLSSSHPVCWF